MGPGFESQRDHSDKSTDRRSVLFFVTNTELAQGKGKKKATNEHSESVLLSPARRDVCDHGIIQKHCATVYILK